MSASVDKENTKFQSAYVNMYFLCSEYYLCFIFDCMLLISIKYDYLLVLSNN